MTRGILAMLMFGGLAMAQLSPPDSKAVYGYCGITVERPNQSGNFGFCKLTGGIGETVPDGYELVIENVSASCSVNENRGLFWLDLSTQLAPSDENWHATVLPLRKMGVRGSTVTLGSSITTRLYAGAGTRIVAYMNLETPDGPPAGCEVRFHARLYRAVR